MNHETPTPSEYRVKSMPRGAFNIVAESNVIPHYLFDDYLKN